MSVPTGWNTGHRGVSTSTRPVLKADLSIFYKGGPDAVVPAVAVAQLSLDVVQCVRVVVDRDEDRLRHRSPP